MILKLPLEPTKVLLNDSLRFSKILFLFFMNSNAYLCDSYVKLIHDERETLTVKCLSLVVPCLSSNNG